VQERSELVEGDLFQTYEIVVKRVRPTVVRVWSGQQRQRWYWLFSNQDKDGYTAELTNMRTALKL